MTLARREKYFVSLAAFFIVIFLVLQFLIFPFFEKRVSLKRGIESRQETLKEIVKLSAEYKAYKNDAKGGETLLKNRKKEFTLFSFLENAAGKTEVKGHIKYMKPSVAQGTGRYDKSMVEMKVDGITLNQLAHYIHLIESPENVVSIKRISIKENKKRSGSLDVIMQVLTIE